jgi:hypothetical protein
MTIDGPINASQEHEQVRISVTKDQTNFERLNGYEGKVVDSKNYASNQEAYANFLFALSKAGFTKGDTSKELQEERGYCPLGRRYIFELIQDGRSIERYWATSCGKPKTYQGDVSLTLQLFQDQIPDYGNLVSNINNL